LKTIFSLILFGWRPVSLASLLFGFLGSTFSCLRTTMEDTGEANGNVQYLDGKYSAAIDSFTAAIEKNPDSSYLYWYIFENCIDCRYISPAVTEQQRIFRWNCTESV